MEVVKKKINDLKPAPYNPRKDLQPYDEEYKRIKNSIDRFGYVDPIIYNKRTGLVVGGHQRLKVLKDLGFSEVDVVEVDLAEDEEKALNIALNKISGEWEKDKLKALIEDLESLNFDVELTGFSQEELQKLDVQSLEEKGKAWFASEDKGEAREDDSKEYKQFLDKFEAKHTTDDCYTPPKVYDAVVEWVEKEYGLNMANFVRPFFPGGDYQHYNYKTTDVVVDNPPFSILAEILNFYIKNNIKFFLFSPHLTIFQEIGKNRKGICALVVHLGITYENNATVSTDFITNLEDEDLKIKTAPSLYNAVNPVIEEIRREKKAELPKYKYPDCLITGAKMSNWSCYGIDFQLRENEVYFTSQLDMQKELKKGVYGGGFLLSNGATEQKRAAEQRAAEQEMAAEQKMAAIVWELSDREKEIVKKLG